MRQPPPITQLEAARVCRAVIVSDRDGCTIVRLLSDVATLRDQAHAEGDWRGAAAAEDRAAALLAEAASWQRRHDALLATAYRLVRARDRAMTRARHAMVCRASRPRTPRRRRCAASRARSSGDDGDGGDDDGDGDGDGPVDRRTRDSRALALVTIPPLSQEGSAKL